jgi:hypothetical protein
MKSVARAVTVAGMVIWAFVGAARADFVLVGNEHMEVTQSHLLGILWDTSTADIRAGGNIFEAYVNNMARLRVLEYSGYVSNVYAFHTSGVDVSDGGVSSLYAYDSSSVDLSGGHVDFVFANNTTTVHLSGGRVIAKLCVSGATRADVSGGTVEGYILAYNHSSVDFSDGKVSALYAYDSSSVDLSGGDVFSLFALGTSATTFHGYDFTATSGLTLDGDKVLGTGVLAGKWFDGTAWAVSIQSHDPGATILAIPEPSSLALLALGGIGMLIRRRGA